MAVVVLLVKQEVLRLDIPMANAVCVQVAQGVEGLLHDGGGLRLAQVLLLGDVIEKFPALTEPTNYFQLRLDI